MIELCHLLVALLWPLHAFFCPLICFPTERRPTTPDCIRLLQDLPAPCCTHVGPARHLACTPRNSPSQVRRGRLEPLYPIYRAGKLPKERPWQLWIWILSTLCSIIPSDSLAKVLSVLHMAVAPISASVNPKRNAGC